MPEPLPAPALSRKGKEREPAPTDLAARMIAFQRRQAGGIRVKDKSERPSSRVPSATTTTVLARKPPTSPPQVILTRTESNDAGDVSVRRKPPSPALAHVQQPSSKPQPKLYNPDLDSIPIRRTIEPEAMSDNGSSSYAPRPSPQQHRDGSAQARLFDHRKDDPVRFNVLVRPPRPTPTPKSSVEYASASSTSSYAPSVTSSSFTLNSTTDSSASSALFDQQPRGESGNSAFAAQLKKLYRAISNLESKLMKEDGKDAQEEDSRITLARPNQINQGTEQLEADKWGKFVQEHKTLAESMHNLLQLTSAPLVPASLRNIPGKYNIIMRLWTYAFNKPLETLRRASFQSTVALEHLLDFIYYAYTFYGMLLEERNLDGFKAGWQEALGDLARYRMLIAAMTTVPSPVATTGPYVPISQESLLAQEIPSESTPRIDDSPGPSVGVAAAKYLEVDSDREQWRRVAREWYATGLMDTPGAGKLHHHLGLLSREAEGEDLRAIYHFAKSLTTLHPFTMSRESILPIWSMQAQAARFQPDARASDLFVLLQGMLFTNIQLDDFNPTLSRFMERLELEGVEEREWTMMAVINLVSMMEFGKPNGVLRKTGGISSAREPLTTAQQAAAATDKVNMVVKRLDQMDVDPEDKSELEKDGEREVKGNGVINVSPILQHSSAETTEVPLIFKYSLQLTFAMLTYALRHPLRKAAQFARPSLNPYITIIMTFLATVLKHDAVRSFLERSIPWVELATFLQAAPRAAHAQADGGIRMTSGCSPLPEDWCLRGMEWGGRRVYERGFWKPEGAGEMEALIAADPIEGHTDGIIEDEDDEGQPISQKDGSETSRRWIRIVRAGAGVAKCVPGFEWEAPNRVWRVTGQLEQKVRMWAEEDKREREEKEARRTTCIIDDMDVDDDMEEATDYSEESGEDEDDSEEVKVLKLRRRELRRLLQSAKRGISGSPPSQNHVRPRKPQSAPTRPALRMIPGYTTLVVDTNILLSSLSIFSTLVESLQWTFVLPLAVITELDGLASNASPLGTAAAAAVQYVTSHIRTHSKSLKVQTSKGNYLSSLAVRSEQIEFDHKSWERNMDDLILRSTMWQAEHWVDRSHILRPDRPPVTGEASRVVLWSFDRNLRLKARARQLDAADEKDMAVILKGVS